MKKGLLVFSAIASLGMAHPNHGPEGVTSAESLLWIRDELKLDVVVYKSLTEKIKLFNASLNSGQVQSYNDSIAAELQLSAPSDKKIAHWAKSAGDQVEKDVAAYAQHLKEIKALLTKEQFASFLSFSSKVYTHRIESVHVHEHVHGETMHSHGHEHRSDVNDHAHAHDAILGDHGHEHVHSDGITHTHTHEHGANTAQHDHPHK